MSSFPPPMNSSVIKVVYFLINGVCFSTLIINDNDINFNGKCRTTTKKMYPIKMGS